MKRIIIFLVFVIFVFGIYYVKQISDKDDGTYYLKEDFDELNREFWYIGEWKTMFAAYEKAKLNNGKIKLEIDEIDKGPFLLSKPISLKNGQSLTVKRRVRLTHTEENFTGGFAILETSDEGLIPSALNSGSEFLGNGVVLVEYVYGYDDASTRPGSNTFRVLPRTWMIKDNYVLIDPIFSNWFEEELIYDTTEKTITYLINGQQHMVTSQEMSEDKFRLYMHGYGFGIGHAVEIDWIEISVE